MMSTTNVEQQDLLKRARGGDDRALEELLKSVQPQLFRFSMKMCRHSEDAEDVLQDTMIALARTFRDFRGASSLSTWLYTVTRNFCTRKRRKSQFAPTREESLESLDGTNRDTLKSTTPGPEQLAETTQFWTHVQAAISTLDPIYREVLVLRDIEGLTAPEVATVTETTLATVKSRLHRARAQLRVVLSGSPLKRGPDCPDIRKIFSAHLEGDLSPTICASMESHVSSCSNCAAECNGLRSALNACSRAPSKLPAEVEQRVKTALRDVLDKMRVSS